VRVLIIHPDGERETKEFTMDKDQIVAEWKLAAAEPKATNTSLKERRERLQRNDSESSTTQRRKQESVEKN
jgi:hypothetical protein